MNSGRPRTGALFLIKQEKNLFKKLSPEICHYFDKQTHFISLPDSRPRSGEFLLGCLPISACGARASAAGRLVAVITA